MCQHFCPLVEKARRGGCSRNEDCTDTGLLRVDVGNFRQQTWSFAPQSNPTPYG